MKLTKNQVRLLNKDKDSLNTVTSFESVDFPDLESLERKGLVYFNGPVYHFSYGLTFKGGLEVYKDRYQGWVVDYKALKVKKITYLVAHELGHEVRQTRAWGSGYILPGKWRKSYFSPEFCNRLFETKKEAEALLAKYVRAQIKEHTQEANKLQRALDALA